jgi:hypothetical protein
MVRWCRRYIREMSAILMHCCIDKIQGLETIMQSCVVSKLYMRIIAIITASLMLYSLLTEKA